MNVLEAAWTASGSPQLPAPTHQGPCSRCGSPAPLVSTRTVVSKTFTAYDGWREPGGRGLCACCAWAYSSPDLRLHPHLVIGEPVPDLVTVSLANTKEILAAGPLPHGHAVTVPLRPGRKHLLPHAHWGRVTLDDLHLPWTCEDASRLRSAVELRTRGFGSRMLPEAAPPWPVLRKHPPEEWPRIFTLWRDLDPWRTTPSPWLDLAIRITTPQERPMTVSLPLHTVVAGSPPTTHLVAISPALRGSRPDRLPVSALCGAPVADTSPVPLGEVECRRCLDRAPQFMSLPSYVVHP